MSQLGGSVHLHRAFPPNSSGLGGSFLTCLGVSRLIADGLSSVAWASVSSRLAGDTLTVSTVVPGRTRKTQQFFKLQILLAKISHMVKPEPEWEGLHSVTEQRTER